MPPQRPCDRSTALPLTALLVSGLACAPVPPPRALDPRAALAANAPPPAAVPPPHPPGVHVLPAIDPIWAAEEGAWIAGSLRAQRADTHHPASGAALPDRGIAATRLDPQGAVRERWLFASADGTVAMADGFTGALTTMAVLPHELVRSARGAGRMAVTDSQGTVWTSDGSASPVPLSLRGAALAAFSTRDEGAAITEGGGLYHTVDGGAHWQSIALRGHAAWHLETTRVGMVALTTGGPILLRSDGTAQDLGRYRPFVPNGFADAEDTLDAVAPWHRLRPRAVLADGSLVYGRNDGRLAHRSLGGGELLAITDPQPNVRPYCEVARWGASALASCPYYPLNDWLRFDARGGLRALEPVHDAAEAPLLSDDGVHAVRRRRCDAPEDYVLARPTRVDALCAYDGARWSTVPLPAPGAPVATAGARVLLAQDAGFAVFDLANHAIRRLAMSPEDALSNYDAFLEADGTAVLAGERADGAGRLLVAASGDAFAPRALPPGALHAAWMGGGRGLAVGATTAVLYWTGDHGAHWRALEVPAAGQPYNLPLEVVGGRTLRQRPDGRTGPALECGREGCLAAQRLWISPWAPRGAVSEVGAPARSVTEVSATSATGPRAWRCEDIASGSADDNALRRALREPRIRWRMENPNDDQHPLRLGGGHLGTPALELGQELTPILMPREEFTLASGATLTLAGHEAVVRGPRIDGIPMRRTPPTIPQELIATELLLRDRAGRALDDRWFTWTSSQSRTGIYATSRGEAGLAEYDARTARMLLSSASAPPGEAPREVSVPRDLAPCGPDAGEPPELTRIVFVGDAEEASLPRPDVELAPGGVRVDYEVRPGGALCVRSIESVEGTVTTTRWIATGDRTLSGIVGWGARAQRRRCTPGDATR